MNPGDGFARLFRFQTKQTKLMKISIRIHPLARHVMKITFLQMLLVCIGISLGYAHEGNGQKLLDRQITLVAENTELREAILRIEREAHVKFVYNPNAIG